uniref:WAP domain-containing protein n=1 Tax=Varanus komodoensis TaxID=61221 RepID=A0A8D2Q411_VARKO
IDIHAAFFLYTDKPGTCPAVPHYCSVQGRKVCSHDYDCPEKQKCCNLPCGKTCVDP